MVKKLLNSTNNNDITSLTNTCVSLYSVHPWRVGADSVRLHPAPPSGQRSVTGKQSLDVFGTKFTHSNDLFWGYWYLT